MPQASKKLRDQMERWFGDPVDDAGPRRFLELRGFKLYHSYSEWIPPARYYTIAVEEFACIAFLQDEWDFGAIDDYWQGTFAPGCGDVSCD